MTLQLSASLWLLICLATIIIPPILAVAISTFRSLTQRYGQTLVEICQGIGTAMVYLAQIAIVLATMGCTKFSMGAFVVHVDPTFPHAIAPVLLMVMYSALVVGFLTMMVVGVYLLEWASSSAEAGTPNMPKVVDVVVEYAGIGRQLMANYAIKVYTNLSGMLSATNTPERLLQEAKPVGEKRNVNTEEQTDDKTGSDDDGTSPGPRLPFEIEAWNQEKLARGDGED